jgi:hypothetical protein
MLLGPNAPLALERERTSYMQHAYDFWCVAAAVRVRVVSS